MDATLVVSLAFLVSPLLGYVIIVLPLTVRQKLVVAAVAVVLLVTVPLVVFLLAGGSNGTSGSAPPAPLAAVLRAAYPEPMSGMTSG